MSLIVKSLHIVGGFLEVLADRTRNFPVVSFATRLVNVTDATGVGVTLSLVTGHLLARNYGGVLAQPGSFGATRSSGYLARRDFWCLCRFN